MDHFLYRDGALYAEDVAVADISASVGTPFYCYSTATLTRHYRAFESALDGVPSTICFAVKSNSNASVLRSLGELGSGADVVSEGELRQSLAAGIDPRKIVFSGVGKTPSEMAFALDSNVGQFNVESQSELQSLNAVAQGKGVRAPIAIRINPDVDAGTHDKISTGRAHDKFGIAWAEARGVYTQAADMEGIDVGGIAVHIGSQITELGPFEAAFTAVLGAVADLRADGHDIRRIDLGGGLGVPYSGQNPPSPKEYGDLAKRIVGGLGCELVIEPGRAIAANAGILVTQVLHQKTAGGHRIVVVDVGMNDFARPAMYDALHDIVPVIEARDASKALADVVGPVCETSDQFRLDYPLGPVNTGDLLAIRSAGAYGSVMGSNYNSRLLAPEVMVKGNEFAVVRPRQTYDDLLAQTVFSPWLGD
jgi:diaminopimelate decarboxylase